MTARPDADQQPDVEAIVQVAKEHQLAVHELLAVMAGESIEEVRAQSKLRERLGKEAKRYFTTPPTEWPFRNMEWDITREAQRFSLDGCSKRDFEKHYPNGFELGWVKTDELDSLLCKFSHRNDDELWAVGSASRLAYLIAYIADGLKVSPPIIKPLDDGTVIITGGHHRYAIARAIRTPWLPVLAYSEHKERLSQFLNVEWTAVDA